jgi:hypothetical protein
MAENHKKIVLTVKQKPMLIKKSENWESATELAKDYGVGIEWLHPWNDAASGMKLTIASINLKSVACSHILTCPFSHAWS